MDSPGRAANVDVVVLGAGPAGLAAAWRAARRGLAVQVLERADRVGGMAASIEVAGVRADLGSHRLHPATPPHVLADLRDLLGDDLQSRPRHGRVRLAGEWVSFPLRPAEMVRRLPPGFLARLARDAATGPLRRLRAGGRAEASYADVLLVGLGPTAYDALYAPYAEKLWGLPGKRISAQQARVRVTADTPWKVLARTLRRQRGGQGRVFYYPRRGFGQIVEAMADAATAAGAQIRLGTEVAAIDVRADSVVVRVTDGAVTEARHALSTLPLPVLARITRPGPPLTTLEAAGRLRFRAMLLVYLVHAGGRWTPYDAHYLPGRETPVTRLSEPANYRVSSDDPADRSVLCAEIPCTVGDDLWRAGEEDLAALVREALRRTGLPEPRLAGVEVRRLPHVYPVFATGYEEDLAGVDAWARGLPTVTTLGRLGLFAHDNSHHALLEAYDAVDALRDDLTRNAPAWAAARERFAAHRVED